LCKSKEGVSWFRLASEDQILEKELTPHGKSSTDHRAVPTFCAGFEGDFLGGPVRQDTAGVAAILGRGIAAGTGQVCGHGKLRTGGPEAAELSQWILCSRFRDPAGDAAPANRARPRPEVSAPGAGA